MSNHLAIATVTATLGALLSNATQVVTGAEVSNVRPGTAAPLLPTVGINIFLYQVVPDAAWRNVDLPTRDSSGRLSQRPQAALDLHYLLNFSGDETKLEPQRLLGAAAAVLHASPVLSREAIRSVIEAAVAADPSHFLAHSDLADQVDLVRFTPLVLGLDELTKLWSVFPQTPYVLSMAYQASVVLIEPQVTPQQALPVRARSLLAIPINQPVIERVISQAGADQPILAGSGIILLGKRLKAETTQVAFGDTLVTPALGDISAESIRVTLPAGLRAGVQGVQVAQQLMLGDPAALHRGVKSNIAAFVLQPKIKPSGGGYDITFTNRTVAGDGTLSGTITVRLNPDVGKAQRVVLLLNEYQPSVPPAAAYSFNAQDRTADGDSVEFKINGVAAHSYLVRLQVDGAESPLDVDDNPASLTYGMYVQPRVDIV